jgi:DNA-binding LacI/PurR family transcriptional regulator
MPVRMKDSARDLGISVVTVSKALRNRPDISAETRALVLRRSEELNYLVVRFGFDVVLFDRADQREARERARKRLR